jgi:prophage regulatory protein
MSTTNTSNTEGGTVLLRLGEVERRVGLKKSAIYRRIAAGTFPAPKISRPNYSRWIEADIEGWIADEVAQHEQEQSNVGRNMGQAA